MSETKVKVDDISIKAYFGTKPNYNSHMAVANDTLALYDYKPKYDVLSPKDFIGIEVELEHLRHQGGYSPFWNPHDDNSLRNSGREFVSIPMQIKNAEFALDNLFSNLNKDIRFSHRTSIHVHYDMNKYTIAEIYKIVLVYLSVEKILYAYAGKDRHKNIFCVPIYLTTLLNSVSVANFTKGTFNTTVSGWQKYSGMNLIPLQTQGTIEFRQLHGTRNVEKIVTWINLLSSIMQYALLTDVKVIQDTIRGLSDVYEYQKYLVNIFGKHTPKLKSYSFSQPIQENLIAVKSILLLREFDVGIRLKESNDSPFVRSLNGTVHEKKTGLEWAPVRPEPAPRRGLFSGLNSATQEALALNAASAAEIPQQGARIPRPPNWLDEVLFNGNGENQ